MHKGLCLLTWFWNKFVWLMTKTDRSLWSWWYIRRGNWLQNDNNERENKTNIDITVLIIKQVCKYILVSVIWFHVFSKSVLFIAIFKHLNFLNFSYIFCKFKRYDRHYAINIKLILRNESLDLTVAIHILGYKCQHSNNKPNDVEVSNYSSPFGHPQRAKIILHSELYMALGWRM